MIKKIKKDITPPNTSVCALGYVCVFSKFCFPYELRSSAKEYISLTAYCPYSRSLCVIVKRNKSLYALDNFFVLFDRYSESL